MPPTPRPAHATAGVWAFVRRRSTAAIDARTSFELVGTMSAAHEGLLGADPLAPMRAWIDAPHNRGRLDASVIEGLERALELARSHWLEIDQLADTIARRTATDGAVDPARLARLDGMTDVLATFSARLRDVVDAATDDGGPAQAERLDRALAAADAGGQLPAFVAAL